MTTKPQALKFGQFHIPEPCPVPWEEMQTHTRGNRFCQQCNEVVFDLTCMSEEEIAALYAQRGGRLCGSFALDENEQPIYFRKENPPQKVHFLKHLAVAASLVLLYQTPQASGNRPTSSQHLAIPKDDPKLHASDGTTPTVTPETNTLISGVILTNLDKEIKDDLIVEVYAKGLRVARTSAKGGFFRFDLEGKLKPTDEVKIVVLSKIYDFGKKFEERKYVGTTIQTTLGNAQNVQIQVQYTPPNRPPRKGGMIYL